MRENAHPGEFDKKLSLYANTIIMMIKIQSVLRIMIEIQSKFYI